MKLTYRTIIVYIVAVIFPTCICSFYFFNIKMEDDLSERKEYAKWIASIHQNHWDQLISETVTTLKMLALVSKTSDGAPKNIKSLLEKAQHTDPRFGGLMLLDDSGQIITSSDPKLIESDQSQKPYIQEVINAKDITISILPETLNNGQRVIGIAQPVLTNEKLNYVIVALLRVDYIENVLKILTPDSKVVLTNANHEVIMKINIKENINRSELHDWITVPINRLPWDINIKVPEQNKQEVIKNSSLFFFVIFVVAHIIFILIKYYLLRKQAIQAREQNEAQKLELVGTLASSTAHEIRNPLTGIKGLIQLLNEKYKNPDDQFYFSVIENEIDRINQIVSEFLILGKPILQKTETLEIKEIFDELIPLISTEANLYNVHFIYKISNERMKVNVSKDQMKQVILNITKNAFESMKENETLTINIGSLKKQCKISISDTGSGISKEDLEKIFNPFFTSKNNGTGLGLVICKRIVEAYNGEIIISSKLNGGTTVEIILPTTYND